MQLASLLSLLVAAQPVPAATAAPVEKTAARHSEAAWCGQAVRRTEDVVYGRKFGTALTMDVFQPVSSNACGILFLVNGGWLSSKDTPLMVTIQPDYYRPFLERGYTVFAVVTSSQPKFTILEEMDDVRRAVRFVRHNAAKFGVQFARQR